jgi:hypothetical protein
MMAIVTAPRSFSSDTTRTGYRVRKFSDRAKLILFPLNPLDRHRPDDAYAAEAAVCDRLGTGWTLIDHDAIVRGGAAIWMSVAKWGAATSNPPAARSDRSDQPIYNPAAPSMRFWSSAVGENCLIRASSFFQRIGQNREEVESTLPIDRLGQSHNRWCCPGSVERDGTKRITKNTAKKVAEVVTAPCAYSHTNGRSYHATSGLVDVLGGDLLGSIGSLGHHLRGSRGIEVRRGSR